MNKCMFMQQSKVTELKNALADSPLTLNLVRIRYQRFHDARAGDIKYHNQYWAVNIVRRTPDFPTKIVTPSSNTDVTVSDNHKHTMKACTLMIQRMLGLSLWKK